jgi:N-acetylmuramoyl-L-alanine amidase
VDSRSRGENIDVFFYHDRRSNSGQKAARILKNTFQRKYDLHQPGRGYSGTVSDRNLYVVRNTYPVAIYIELGNINHRRDQQRFIIPSNRQALANWLFEGLTEDFKTNK